jgi:2-keto-myo-inositol isomerase
MSHAISFALNRISAPRVSFPDYLALCQRLGIATIELRNDLDGVEIQDGTSPVAIREQAREAGITIRSINALYPFDMFDRELEQRALALARTARDCGAEALVMCPLNSRDDPRNSAERARDLVAALKSLRPILDDHGLQGLLEPLGFEECSLRRKSDAVTAIYAAAGERQYQLVHDTFHHFLAGEEEFFPDQTGLVHISGVEAADLEPARMRDGDRVLVGAGDRLETVRQLRTLIERGYPGVVSFEPFARDIMAAQDSERRLRESMDYIRVELGRNDPLQA